MSTLPLLALLAACSGPAPDPDGPGQAPPDAPEVRTPRQDPPPAARTTMLTVDTSAGPITITPVMHATTIIQADGRTIWLDPWSEAPLDGQPPADLILLTDVHPDHLDGDAIAAVSKPGTAVVAPPAVAARLGEGRVQHVLANGDEVTLGALTLRAVPAYNEVRGPEGGGVFHEKGRGNGYLLTLGDKTVYFAGDTECVPEIRALTGVEVAFLPMNLPYTMTPEEAAACARAFAPARAVPYHYRGSDRDVFVRELAGSGVAPVLLEYYPGGEEG